MDSPVAEEPVIEGAEDGAVGGEVIIGEDGARGF